MSDDVRQWSGNVPVHCRISPIAGDEHQPQSGGELGMNDLVMGGPWARAILGE